LVVSARKDGKLEYEIVESDQYPGHWHVEAIGSKGEIYVAVFSGAKAIERAAEYANWKNGIQR